LELCSSNPFTQPKIFLNLYEKPDDLYRMMSALKFAREILKQPPLSTVWGVKEIGFDDEFGKWCNKDGEMSDEDWERYIRGKVKSKKKICIYDRENFQIYLLTFYISIFLIFFSHFQSLAIFMFSFMWYCKNGTRISRRMC